MILVDTSIWIDHLRAHDELLFDLLQNAKVIIHPFITGELAVGSLKRRHEVMADLKDLPQAIVANHDEVLHFIDSFQLFGTGLSYVDVHLLASTQLAAGGRLWTRDQRLHMAAVRLQLEFTSKVN